MNKYDVLNNIKNTFVEESTQHELVLAFVEGQSYKYKSSRYDGNKQKRREEKDLEESNRKIKAKTRSNNRKTERRSNSDTFARKCTCCYWMLYSLYYIYAYFVDFILLQHEKSSMFTHCEHGFRNQNGCIDSYSIVRGSNTQIKQKKYRHNGYHLVSISVSSGQRVKMIEAGDQLLNTPFDFGGMFRSAWLPVSETEGNWCSRNTCLCLQAAGLMKDYNANSVSPDDIYDYINNSSLKTSTTPIDGVHVLR
jgi:hypothetical protein